MIGKCYLISLFFRVMGCGMGLVGLGCRRWASVAILAVTGRHGSWRGWPVQVLPVGWNMEAMVRKPWVRLSVMGDGRTQGTLSRHGLWRVVLL